MRLIGLAVVLALGLAHAPLAVEGQPATKIARVGVLEPTPQQHPAPCIFALQQGLRDLGYVEGQTILFAYRYGEGQNDRLPALARELIQHKPDVLWTHSNPGALAAKQATTTIPIVVGVAIDLVERGLTESLARPGGNLTGLELRPVELAGKRLQLFKETVPTITRVAVLVDPAWTASTSIPNAIASEARALGVQLQRVEARTPAAFEAAFAAMARGRADALMIMESEVFAAHRQQLATLALRHRLPAMSYGPHHAEAGSLLAYGADPRELCQRSAVFVDKILKGAKPADLPIERADKFPFVINLKTAKALGLTIPQSILLRADQIIEK
jgi:putative tryptophan/tyrosine transport system substrate-binding protein